MERWHRHTTIFNLEFGYKIPNGGDDLGLWTTTKLLWSFEFILSLGLGCAFIFNISFSVDLYPLTVFVALHGQNLFTMPDQLLIMPMVLASTTTVTGISHGSECQLHATCLPADIFCLHDSTRFCRGESLGGHKPNHCLLMSSQ